MEEETQQKHSSQNEPPNHLKDNDAQLVYRTLHEDQDAYAQIVRSYTPIFYSLIKRFGPDKSPETIEDELQEIFLHIYKALPSYQVGSPFYSWAYTIALNWIRSQYRKDRRAKKRNMVPYDENIGVLQGNRITDSPEHALVVKEASSLLDQALQNIKQAYREVFILRMMQDLSVSETAKILDLPEGTVKTYLHRGRQQLRKWLEKHQWNNDG